MRGTATNTSGRKVDEERMSSDVAATTQPRRPQHPAQHLLALDGRSGKSSWQSASQTDRRNPTLSDGDNDGMAMVRARVDLMSGFSVKSRYRSLNSTSTSTGNRRVTSFPVKLVVARPGKLLPKVSR